MTMVTFPKTSRRDRKKSAVRSKIIATAIESFSRQGIGNVTVEQIAEAADIGKGTIYNYFDTKEAIVVAFMVDIENKVQSELHRFAKSRGDLASILTDFLLFQFRSKEPYYQFVRVFLGQMFNDTEHFLPYIVEMQKVIDPPLEALFRALQDRRVLRRDIDLQELIPAFKTIHLGLTGLWAIEGPPFTQASSVLRLQMKLFSKGLDAGS
jgi:AcrR family transcriptional regulator